MPSPPPADGPVGGSSEGGARLGGGGGLVLGGRRRRRLRGLRAWSPWRTAAGLVDQPLEARALQAAERPVGAGAVQDGDLEVGRGQFRLAAVGLAGRGRRRRGGERRQGGRERLGERHAVGEALLERRRHLVGLAAEGDEARLIGHRAVPGDAVDLVAVRLGADLGDDDLHLIRLARRLAEVGAERLGVPVGQAARGHVAAVELVAGHVRVGDAGLAQHLVLVVPADRGERDPVVDLADLVQHAGDVGGHQQDAARVLHDHRAAAARHALARVVGLVAHRLLGRHIERHGHRGRSLIGPGGRGR